MRSPCSVGPHTRERARYANVDRYVVTLPKTALSSDFRADRSHVARA